MNYHLLKLVITLECMIILILHGVLMLKKTFVLFADPVTHGVDGSNKVLGEYRNLAYTLQQIAGGTGDLKIYQQILNK